MERSWVDFAAIKQTISITQVLDHYQIKLRRSGRELRGSCPLHHGEGGNSFHANIDKNAFHCFSCGAKGNILELTAALEQCSLREAALKLQDWFSAHSSTTNRQPSNRSGVEAKSSAEPETGPGERDAENKPLPFSLKGIDHRHPYLRERGIEFETAEYFGVGLFSGRGSMQGRIVIPIENEAGQLVAYAGRAIDGSEPKYKLPTGFYKNQVLFNLPRAREEAGGGRVVLVEGFFDCMKVTQAEQPCVALMGCSLSEPQQAQLIRYFPHVIVMLDGDEAGRNAAGGIAARLARHLWVRIAEVPKGRQPDELSNHELQTLLK
ncbi:MAG TPA: CHC2 zinc finger domain-containing protein [Bryobacteraceae bacterium]|nr:CHC2 zinc finger domain-containing protein [Bryobacteraceae bacterium]